MDKKWYVVWVATGKEKDVYLALQKLPGIDRTLFPVEDIIERKDGEQVKREKIIFPGYLFVECRMDGTIYYPIKQMPHVLGWLGKDSMWPHHVKQAEMDALLQMLACVEAGTDPSQWLDDVKVNKRQLVGYGTLTIHGKAYRVPFNVPSKDRLPDEQDNTDNQPDEP